ncbi:MAG: sigma-70 family RNA polymerase sigma factor [Acidobacteriia bacterium]|jgi:RNA polymerase sigma-70 factor (ECF subfamily)|nr:sigma-70 family RNA polymerase sigma factor [Terriglobia bacterium]
MGELAQALAWGRDEAEFVTELQAGSATAFDWLVTHYHAPVYNLVYSILGDAADAADVTQEVFLKAYRGIQGFRGGSSLKTWLYRIGVREALNHRRWWRRHLRWQTSMDDPNPDGRQPAEPEATAATPFDSLATREVQQAVRRALAQLPESYRSAVILRDLEGFAYEEIAELLDISVGTVKSRILRGRRRLRELLAPILNQNQEASLATAPLTREIGYAGAHPGSGGGS